MESTIHFLNRRGERLFGTHHTPDGESPYGVVMGHCFTCTRHTGILREAAARLTDAGFQVLRFDFSGNGQSEGVFIDTSYTQYITEMKDAADYLKSNGVTWLGLMGHSMGAAVSILAASRQPGIQAVCTLAGRLTTVDPAGIFSPQQLRQLQETGRLQFISRGRQLELDERFLNDMRDYDIQKVVTHLNLQVLVIHGTADEIISADQAIAAQMLNPDHLELFMMPGADHFFSQQEHRSAACRKIADWFTTIRQHDVR
jgi:putative redox protein